MTFDLPAETLAPRCYAYMFFDDILLENAPVIKATTLATESLELMFANCDNLTSIKIYYTGEFDRTDNAFDGFFCPSDEGMKVKKERILYYNGDDTEECEDILEFFTIQKFTVE